MSQNLHLRGFSLFQTPTEVTYAAMAEGADPKAVYFAFLDEWVSGNKPKIHPRATNAQVKAIKSTPAWRDYQAQLQQVADHKEAVETFLAENPRIRWKMM